MGITKKGKKWEIMHSLWIIWSFIWLANGVGMYMAGKKTRVQKWYRFGLIYTATGWITMIIGTEVLGNSILSSVAILIFFGTHVACIVHSFSIRKEYLMRLEMIEEQKAEQMVTNNLREKIAKEYGMNSNGGNYSTNNNSMESRNDNMKYQSRTQYNNGHINENQQTFNSEMNFNQNEQTFNREENTNKEAKIHNNEETLETSRIEKFIDVNLCTEDELLQLPGVGVIEAKKAINYRNNNEFNSVDEFIEVLNIKPHFAEKIRTMLICNKTKNNQSMNTTTSGVGRMVDF